MVLFPPTVARQAGAEAKDVEKFIVKLPPLGPLTVKPSPEVIEPLLATFPLMIARDVLALALDTTTFLLFS